MTTPGRTHIPWETQDGQVAELISYISFLEAKLQYLQLHHEHCNLRSAPLDSDLDMELPYLPPDVVIANEEAEVAKVHIPLTPPLPLEPFPIASVPAVQPMPKKGTIPRWKRIVDQMMAGWGQPSSWEDKRMDIGLNSVAQNQVALTLILGLRNENPQHDPSHAFPFPDMETHSPPASPTEALIYSARQYALDTKASKMNADFVVPLHTFRELVFASLCVVMEQQGLPIDTINGLMRICMSSSGPANLYRLRRGALWVNRVIAGTLVAKMGWRRSGTEFFLLCEYILCVVGGEAVADVGSWAAGVSIWASLGGVRAFVSVFVRKACVGW
jgi:hypothetical protein